MCAGHALHFSRISRLYFVPGYAVNLSLEMSVSCQDVLIGVLKYDFDDQAYLVLRAAVLQRVHSAAARQLADPSRHPDQATEDFNDFSRCYTWSLLGASVMYVHAGMPMLHLQLCQCVAKAVVQSTPLPLSFGNPAHMC